MSDILRLVRICCVVSITCGCVIVPFESGSDASLHGNAVGPAEWDSLKIGQSTRKDVIALLGQPTIDFREYRLFAYISVQYSGSWLVLGYLSWTIVPTNTSKGVFLAFDAEEKLFAKGTHDMPVAFGSVMEAARDWMESNGVKPPPKPAEPVWAAAPDEKGVIVVLRNGPTPDRSWFTAWDPIAIALEGQFRAELTDDTYIALVCDPGSYTVSADARPLYRPVSHASVSISLRQTHRVDLSAGEVVFLRAQSGIGDGPVNTVLERLSPSDGRDSMQKVAPAW